MGVKLPPCLSLRPFLPLLQLALLIFVASAISGPARADDCGNPVKDTCLHEVITSNGNSRILTVTLNTNPPGPPEDQYFNVIAPRRFQFEVIVGGKFTLNVQPDGTAIYSVQYCVRGFGGTTSDCNAWTQVTRRDFAPASACQSYMDAAMTAVNQSDNLGCGFSGAGRWDHNAQAHLDACLSVIGDWQSFINNETSGRANDLAACKAKIAAAVPCPSGQIRYQGNCQAPPLLPGSTTGSGGGFIQLIPSSSGSGAASATPPAGSGYVLACQGGGDMNVSGGGAVLGGSSFFIVSFNAAAQGASAAPPDPGTCAWIDRALRPGEPLALNVPSDLDGADKLNKAIKGGTFEVHANTVGKELLVNQIDSVELGGKSKDAAGVSVNIGTSNAGGGNGGSVLQPPIAENTGGGQPMTVAKAVNVYTKAGGGSALGSLAAGTAVTSLGCGKGWCHIQFTGGEGYIAQSSIAPQ